MRRYIIAVAALLVVIGTYTSDEPPIVIVEFCAKKFHGDIAGKNEPFNATDVVWVRELPTRRILGYFVTSTTSFLWYEHGGRGYHQHLVRFSAVRPEQVEASYVFFESKHRRIEDLIKDTEFLRSNVDKSGEL